MKRNARNQRCICLILFLLILCLGGCSSKTKSTYRAYAPADGMNDTLTQTFYDNIKIKITPPKDDTAPSAQVKVTLPDLAAIYQANKEEFLNTESTEDYKEILRKHMDDYTITNSITEEVYLDDSSWKLNSTRQIDAMIGEIIDAYLSSASSEIGIAVEIGQEDMELLIQDIENQIGTIGKEQKK